MDNTLKLHNTNYTAFTAWNSTRLPVEEMNQPDTTHKPKIKYSKEGKLGVKSDYSILIQERPTFKLKNNNKGVYIVYDLENWPINPSNNVSIKNCLFRAAKLTRNGIKRYFIYYGYRITFDGSEL